MIQSLFRIAYSEIVQDYFLDHKNRSVRDTGRIPCLFQSPEQDQLSFKSFLFHSMQLQCMYKLLFCSVLGMWVPAGQAIGKYVIWDRF